MKHALIWLAASVLTLGVGALAGNGHAEAEADREDEAALHSRAWAAQRACGPGREAEWLDDKSMRCLRRVEVAR
ncbi:hypothetical protein [Acidovorax sp. SUPP2539]|uniref:hypothetical protein n=1 Tax=Acidovorax sp. SUPP2539 TaxID=2920878 RepID=UPI0023DE51CE|nr:hypothetical protein [Acidovorax sp. SUPP2539]GKS91182.1 hypothetical protein AVTE2539_17475 [Acidovorax sp. SUPP2539]